MNALLQRADFAEIYSKVCAGERLSIEDGLRLFTSNDILALGCLANLVRERKNGNKAYFIYNQHINSSTTAGAGAMDPRGAD